MPHWFSGYYKHLLTLPQQFFDTMRVGEIISRVEWCRKDSFFYQQCLTRSGCERDDPVLHLPSDVCVFMEARLPLVSPSVPACVLGFNRLNRKYQRPHYGSAADLESQLVESINSISTIKRFGIEEYANLKTETLCPSVKEHVPQYHELYYG